MTIIQFSPGEVERWAAFSGDYNPIHFSTETARRLVGDDGPFIHGMLAMLPLKRAFTDNLMHMEEGGTWRWHAQLRRPMPIAGQYRLVSQRQANGSARYELRTAIDNERFITAIAAPQAAFPAVEGPGEFLLDPQAVSDLNRCSPICPHIRSNWIGLDALLFQCYVRTHLPEFLRNQGLDAAINGQTELLMQISHTLIAERWALVCEDIHPYAPFTYDVALVGTALAGRTRYATLQLSLFGNRRPFLIQELSLMLAHPTPRLTPELGIPHDPVTHP